MEYYKLTKEEVISNLNSNISGLSEKEVEERRAKFGNNEINVKHSVSFLKLVIDQFKNYLAWLLIFIAVFAFFAGFYFNREEQVIDGMIISIIIVVNVFVGAYQDFKSEKTAQLLKSMRIERSHQEKRP